MNKYVFNARDIAAYMKWFGVPNYLEVSYMQFFFGVGNNVLAAPLTRDFEVFKNAVYRELYYLWANGFEDDKSDISNMTSDGTLSLICDQDCINLESYMKLICLHLIFSRCLPYVGVNFCGLPYTLGIECDFEMFEKNVLKVTEGLNLICHDKFDNAFDLHLGVPDEVLRVSLNPEFKMKLLDQTDFKMMMRNRDKEHMNELKKKSLELNKVSETKDSENKKKSTAVKTEDKVKESVKPINKDTKKQPKGAPLETEK